MSFWKTKPGKFKPAAPAIDARAVAGAKSLFTDDDAAAPAERTPVVADDAVVREKDEAFPALQPAAPGDTAVPRSLVNLARVRDYDDLMAFRCVLSEPGAALAVSPETMRAVVVLLLDDKQVAVVCLEAFYGSTQHLSLLDRCRQAGYQVSQQIICEDPTLLRVVYEKSSSEQKAAVEPTDVKADSVQAFETLIAEAVAERATDVHVLMRENLSTVWFRIDGLMRKHNTYPTSLLDAAVGVAYTKLALEESRSHPAYNPRLAQSCSVPLSNIGGRDLTLRYQSFTVVGGHDVVMRVLFTDDGDKPAPSLAELGYSPTQVVELELAARKTPGAIIVSGVTGSGKSTTLKTLLTMREDRHLFKTYSVEDPAEYRIPGVSQVSVQRTASSSGSEDEKNPFLEAMRVVMRADPDTVMVGEVRDRESGSLLKSMVQSGHQVMTTVHASSAIEIIERLSSDEIGLMRQTLASRSFISALVYQKLLPLNCDHCKRPAMDVLPAGYLRLVQERFGIDPAALRVARDGGCEHCKFRGTKGQTVAAEVLVPDATVLKLIRQGLDIEAEETWRSQRTARFDEANAIGKTAFEHALYKMAVGLLDPRNVEAAFQPFATYQVAVQPAPTEAPRAGHAAAVRSGVPVPTAGDFPVDLAALAAAAKAPVRP